MIPKKYYKIIFTILMGTTMGFAITTINLLIAVLTNTTGWINALQAFPFLWLRAMLIATPVAYFIVPPLQKMTNKLVQAE